MKVPREVRAFLGQATDTFNSVPLVILLVGHSFACASFTKGKYGDRYLIDNLAGFIISFGGGTLSALLIQDPEHVPPIWFAGDMVMIIWGLCWWALNYSPGNIVWKLWKVKAFSALCMQLSLAILRAGIIAQRVDYIMASHPGNNITALIMGVIGSCGGGMIVDAIDIGAGYSRSVSELGAPTYSLRSGLFMSIFHWLSVHRYGLLTSRESLGLITIFFVGQTLSACLFGIPLDYTRALGKLLHKITLIPEPKGKTPPALATTHKPVTRSQTAAAAQNGISGDEVAYAGTPSSVKKTPRRKSVNGKAE
ncbi:hypothetical protein QBZ16_003911 [Prototheca wickerhamii]|uniref:Uncharacterized protein n=1 Tax=Prototheca wickerhamii TaxID=3111 RepID=A0AAD9II93_PROWI|nr:hypothetical protein QBZ16_003911 [Prototheca wickerhamii]